MCKNKLNMKKMMTGTSRFVALLVTVCFGVVVVMCTAVMAEAVGASDGAHCSDEPALADCLMSKVGHGVMNEFVFVNIICLMVGGVVFVLRYKKRELQEIVFRHSRRLRYADVLYFRDFLIELFSRGIVRSKIYDLV